MTLEQFIEPIHNITRIRIVKGKGSRYETSEADVYIRIRVHEVHAGKTGMKGVDSLIVIAAIAIFMAGVVAGMVLMALAVAAKRNNERIERAEKHD